LAAIEACVIAAADWAALILCSALVASWWRVSSNAKTLKLPYYPIGMSIQGELEGDISITYTDDAGTNKK
jgi:hypothetical protein